MISGIPIIATPYTDFEIDAMDLIRVASGVSEWSMALDDAIANRDSDKRARREALARENTYEARLEQQRALLAAFWAE